MTAKQLRQYLKSKGSPLAPYTNAIIRAGRKYGVDPRLIVAISGQETRFGTYGPAQRIKNAWGWGPHIQFGSWQEGIDAIAKGLRTGYLDQGLRTVGQIGAKWAPVGAANDPTGLNNHWAAGVNAILKELGGPVEMGPGKRPFVQGPGGRRSSRGSQDLTGTKDAARIILQELATTGKIDPMRLLELAVERRMARERQPERRAREPGRRYGGDGRPAPSGRLIGVPHSGTHTLGNWESDNAIDLGMKTGTPIYAVADGVIGDRFGSLNSGNPRMAGLRLHLIGKGNHWYYAHLSRFAKGIKPGARVRKGQLIGYSGSANGVEHLHFSSQVGDPRNWWS